MSDLPPPTEPVTIQRPASETPSDVVKPNPVSTSKTQREKPRRTGEGVKSTISKSKLKSLLKSALKSGVRGGVGGVISDIAINGALDAVQSLLDSAAEPVKRTDTDTNTSSVIGTPPDYQIEFLFDGKSFDTIQEAKNYVFSDYFKKFGYKKTRNNEGYYVEEVDVNYNERCYSGPGVGCMRIFTHIGHKSSDYQYNIGGWYERYQINIAKVGKLDQIKETGSIKDYEQAQAQAKDRAINAAVEQYVNALSDEQLQQFNDAQAQAQQPQAHANANNSVSTNAPSNDTTQDKDKYKDNTSGGNTPKPNATVKQPNPPKLDFKLPAFCDWAKPVCDALQWLQQEPEDVLPPDEPQFTPTKAPDLSHKLDKDYVKFAGECPPPTTIHFLTSSFEIVYDPFCELFSRISPLIKALAYISGAFIVVRK